MLMQTSLAHHHDGQEAMGRAGWLGNVNNLAEVELGKLQRRLRVMDGSRRSYATESRLALKKQRHTIEHLRAEKTDLEEDWRLLLAKQSQARRTAKGRSHRFESRAEKEQLKRKFDEAQETRKNLARNIAELESELKEARQLAQQQQQQTNGSSSANPYAAHSAGSGKSSESISPSDRLAQTLENRLHKVLVRYNESLSTNRSLRSLIDNLRREKASFESVFLSYQSELADIKAQISQLVEASNSAHEDREDAQAKIRALTERGIKEKAAFDTELRELERTIEGEKKLKEFLATKSMSRGADNPANAMERAARSSARNDKESHNKNEAAILKKLQEETSTTNSPDELFDHIVALRQSNFSLFLQANDLLYDRETLMKEVETLQSCRDSCVRRNEEVKDLNQALMASVENERKARADTLERKRKELETLSNTLKEVNESFLSLRDLFAAQNVTINDNTSPLEVLSLFEQVFLKKAHAVSQEGAMHIEMEEAANEVENLRLPSMGDHEFEDGWLELAESRPLTKSEIESRASEFLVHRLRYPAGRGRRASGRWK